MTLRSTRDGVVVTRDTMGFARFAILEASSQAALTFSSGYRIISFPFHIQRLPAGRHRFPDYFFKYGAYSGTITDGQEPADHP